MLSPVGRAGTGIATPLLKAGDSTFGANNWTSLDAALRSAGNLNGTVQLPAGPIYLESGKFSSVNIDETRAFLTLRGTGRDKTVLIPNGDTVFSSLAFASTLVGNTKDGTFSVGGSTITLTGTGVLANYQPGEVVYFWKRQTSATNDRSVRQRLIVTTTSGTNTVNFALQTIGSGPPTPDDFMHIKGFAISGAPAAGDTTVTLVTTSLYNRFNVGDDILIGDGPGINEFYGEWVRVVSVNSSMGVVTFSPPLQQSYGSSLSCVVPGWLNPRTNRRQHMTDIVLRDLSICAPTSGDYAGVFGVVRAGTRIRFENVGFIGSPFVSSAPTLHDIAFATCGNVTIRDGQYDGKLTVNLVQDLTIDNVMAGGLAISEFSRSANVLNVTTTGTPGIEINNGLCTGINLVNCTVRGDAVMNIFAEDARIDNLTAPQLNLLDGSSGVLVSPLAPDPTQVVDGTTAGSWLEPLQRQVLDRKVVSGADSHVTLELEARSGQTADLQQWQDDSGDPLFAVRADGDLVTANSEEESPPESIRRRLKIYDPSGALLGYIPIHQSS